MSIHTRQYFEDAVDGINNKMVDRLVEKSRDWGASWRELPFEDYDLIDRLNRAVGHLVASLQLSADELDQDVIKRAADVANLAMMAADPQRVRSQPTQNSSSDTD